MAQVSNQSIQPVYPGRLLQPPRRGRSPVLVREQRLAIPDELLTTVALRTSEVTLNRLLKTTKILVWEAEAEAESWRFTYVGKQAKEMLGYPITDWYEPDFLDRHLHPEDKNQILSQRHADQYDLTFRMIAGDGRVVWFQNLISVTSRYGKTRRMSGFMIDISERKRNEENLTDLSGRLIAAQEKERGRIACELHDDFNQRLALLSIELEQLGKTIPKVSDNCQLLQKIQRQIQEISADIHRLSYRLHPSKLDHLGLAAAVKSLCEEVSESGKLKIEFQEHGFPAALEKDTALCLFRVAQEALRNSVKHSGAQSVRVLLWKTINAVRVSVADDGNGFDPESEVRRSGLGFISMRERVQTVGGQMQIHSQPQCGTCISVSVPLRGDPDPVIKNDLKTGLQLQNQKQQEATPLLRAVKSRD